MNVGNSEYKDDSCILFGKDSMYALQKKDDADADADADDNYNLFFFYGKGGRCFSHCPGSSKGCAPHWKNWKV